MYKHTERQASVAAPALYWNALWCLEWVWDRFLSVTMYSNASGNASVNASIAADARCGCNLKLQTLTQEDPRRYELCELQI